MKQFKVCMLGGFAVGKTSLVARFVEGVFSEDYQTTVGVKIDRKDLALGDDALRMILWDLNGEDRFLRVQPSYLRGSSGGLLVIDGTRAGTVDTAVDLDQRLRETVGDIPVVALINKSDLGDQCAVDPDEVAARVPGARCVLVTSAKSGDGVEEAFSTLGRHILESRS